VYYYREGANCDAWFCYYLWDAALTRDFFPKKKNLGDALLLLFLFESILLLVLTFWLTPYLHF
jgi:hypothetical protein